MNKRQPYDSATPYYGEKQPYEEEIAKLKAAVAIAEESAGDSQELERINAELAYNLAAEREAGRVFLDENEDLRRQRDAVEEDLANEKRRTTKLLEALDFYGCADHYTRDEPKQPIVNEDGGKRARAVLAETGGDNE